MAFDGKIDDLRRDTTAGFSAGQCHLTSLAGDAARAEVVFQNENLSVYVDGRLRGVVPDLICIVDRETGAPIPTQSLRYGQRVKVITASAPPALRDVRARDFFGPTAFGMDECYVPVEELDGLRD